MTYGYSDIIEAYGSVGVGPGEVVYVTSNIGRLMVFESPGKEAVLKAHFDALMELLGPQGTLVCATATLNLCNTDIAYDPATTPSNYAGMLSEYIRQQDGAVRSFHPFRSYCAIGARAEEIAADVSRAAYGPFTPEARLVEMDALSLPVGQHPNLTASTVHHCEQTMAVPYRYMKEYMHPVVRDGKIVIEPFYLYVWYRNSDIERSLCKWVMNDFMDKHEVRSAGLGRGVVHCYRTRAFFDNTIRLMKDDPYIWCETPPTIRPWRK